MNDAHILGFGALALLALAAVLGWRRLMRRLEAASVADWGRPWINRLDGLNRLFCRRFHRFRFEPVPLGRHGPALLASNHVSGLDPLLLAAACRRPVRFVIAEEQYRRFGLTWFFRAIGCIPVDREARPARAFRQALKALRDGEVVALFPHGRIHLDSDPPRRLKPGVARMAQLSRAPVYPVRLDGIRGQGRLVFAVFMRSRARLSSFAPLDCAELATADCLARLADCLEGRERPSIAN